MLKRSSAISLLLVYAVSARAGDMTLSEFQANKAQVAVISYVNGVGQGYLYANALLISQGKPAIYCQPVDLTLIGFNYMRLIEAEAKRTSTVREYRSDTSVEMILLNALRVNFPCGK